MLKSGEILLISIKTKIKNAPTKVLYSGFIAIPVLIQLLYFNRFAAFVYEISDAVNGTANILSLTLDSICIIIILVFVFFLTQYLSDNEPTILSPSKNNHPSLIPINLPHDIVLYYQLDHGNATNEDENEIIDDDEMVLEDEALNELIGYVPNLASKMQEFQAPRIDHEVEKIEQELEENKKELVKKIAGALQKGPLNEGIPITEVTTLSEILLELENNQNQ